MTQEVTGGFREVAPARSHHWLQDETSYGNERPVNESIAIIAAVDHDGLGTVSNSSGERVRMTGFARKASAQRPRDLLMDRMWIIRECAVKADAKDTGLIRGRMQPSIIFSSELITYLINTRLLIKEKKKRKKKKQTQKQKQKHIK